MQSHAAELDDDLTRKLSLAQLLYGYRHGDAHATIHDLGDGRLLVMLLTDEAVASTGMATHRLFDDTELPAAQAWARHMAAAVHDDLSARRLRPMDSAW